MAIGKAIAAGLLASLAAWAASASEYTADSSEEEHVPVVVRDYFRDRDAAQRAMKADLDHAQMMARHHQGAADMARYYLNDPRGTNPVVRHLARSIIRNQDFEIAVLHVVRDHVSAGPQESILPGTVALSRGVDGLEHEWRFTRAAPPSPADLWLRPALRVSAFDVQFARPMIEHHAAAIDMALRYNRNPDGRSSIIGPMNTGIMVDQRYEIGLMRQLLARYSGNVDAVPDDPRMMELMRQSMSGMQHGAGMPH